jgi:hypothetical protein
VITTERQQLRAVAEVASASLDVGDRLGDVERVDRDVAGVDNLPATERRDVERAPGR